MPYRTFRVLSRDGQPETFVLGVDNRAVTEWLAERAELRRRGYPDRPPDIDTPTLRAWLPRRGEQGLLYFANRLLAKPAAESIWPVYTAIWHAPDRATTKVLVSGTGDGGIVSRVVIEHRSGRRPIDKVKVYPPDADPDM